MAQLLRADLLPEAWIAPVEVRQLRALLRHRASLVRLGTSLRHRIHAVAADHGYDRSASYWTGPGRGWLAGLDLPAASREIVTDCLAVIDGLAPLIDRIDGELRQHAKADPRVKVLQTLPGVGQFTALVLRVCGKGTKVVLVLLPPAVGRAIDRAIGSRARGPVLLNSRGARMDRHAATRRLRRLAQAAGLRVSRAHPHMLRHILSA